MKLIKKKADILFDVLLKERERYIYLIDHYLKTLQKEINVGKMIHALSDDMQRWRDMCYTKNALSDVQLTALATASDQTFIQITTVQTTDSNPVVLYKHTSLGLKNLDDEKPISSDPLRRVLKSSYITRSSLSPQSEIPIGKIEIDTSNVPIGFPAEPEKVPDTFTGTDKEIYKEWMKKKFVYDNWLNSLAAYRQREKEGNRNACKKILQNLNASLLEDPPPRIGRNSESSQSVSYQYMLGSASGSSNVTHDVPPLYTPPPSEYVPYVQQDDYHNTSPTEEW